MVYYTNSLVSLALVSSSLAGILMCASEAPNTGSREKSLSGTGNTTSRALKPSWTVAAISDKDHTVSLLLVVSLVIDCTERDTTVSR